MIHILNPKTDALVGWISRVIEDSHKNSIYNEETYEFRTPKSEPYSELISERSRILIPAEEGDYREFIVYATNEFTSSNVKEVYASGSFLDLNKLKIINPQVLDGQTVNLAAAFVLTGISEWKLGIVEYGKVFKWVIDRHKKGYDALKEIAILSGLELRFRITTNGETVTGRYVDFIKKGGMNRGKENVVGKDLMGVTRKVHSDRIVTSLHVLAPDRGDGFRQQVMVTNDAAFQNWNRKGRHLTDTYEPEVDADISLEQLTIIGERELQKRINAVVEYDIESVALDHILGHEHEVVMIGDTVRVKDEYFNPPIYLEARVAFIDRSIFKKSKKKYKLGEVIQYKKDDITKTWQELQNLYGTKIIRSDTPPAGRQGILWLDTSKNPALPHIWNTTDGIWEPVVNETYTWIMYADNEWGVGISSDPTDKTYMGISENNEVETPSNDPTYYTWSKIKGDAGLPGEDAWRVEITSSNGNIFKNGDIHTRLTATVYRGDDDVTNSINVSRFRWTRKSVDTEADAVWNTNHFSGRTFVDITPDDVRIKAMFECVLLDENLN